jgi:hypothetical protein
VAERRWTREAGSAAVVCVATWGALGVGAGNTGLQRSISAGALSLFERPLAVALVAAVAFGSASLLVALLPGVRPSRLLAWILAGDLIAGLVLAPLLIGELEPVHAPLVVAAVAVAGVQPLAAVVGALAGWAVAGRRRPGR